VSIDHALMRCARSANKADGSSPIGHVLWTSYPL
jgi:hypothetical protein